MDGRPDLTGPHAGSIPLCPPRPLSKTTTPSLHARPGLQIASAVAGNPHLCPHRPVRGPSLMAYRALHEFPQRRAAGGVHWSAALETSHFLTWIGNVV